MSVHEQIIKQNIAFVYGRSKEEAKHDPDKRTFVKSVKPIDPFADLGQIVSSFVGEFEALHPAYVLSPRIWPSLAKHSSIQVSL